MTSRIFYTKTADGEFEPVKMWSDGFDRAFGQGAHLVVVDEGWQGRTYDIRPDYASVLAALKLFREDLTKRLAAATDVRPRQKTLTAEQRAAWQKLNGLLNDPMLEYPSVVEAVDTALEGFEDRTADLLQNPSICKAYEKLEMLIELQGKHCEEG